MLKNTIDLIDKRSLVKYFNRFYITSHVCCPNCGSNDLNGSIGFCTDIEKIITNKYKDTGKIECNNCGWKGIAHELSDWKKFE